MEKTCDFDVMRSGTTTVQISLDVQYIKSEPLIFPKILKTLEVLEFRVVLVNFERSCVHIQYSNWDWKAKG